VTPPPGGSIPVCRPHLFGDEAAHLLAALAEGSLSGNSPAVGRFEDAFARWAGVPHAVAVSSGTAALHVALAALGIGPGDEVVVPDFSMISPVLAILYQGAVPVPADVDHTWNLDPGALDAVISPRTRAILVVHTYGHPARLPELRDVARARSIPLVEDVAEALGARVRGERVGSAGDLACHSFYANKIITTGEGGMVTTSDPALAEAARRLRNLCFGDRPETRFIHDRVGFNYRLSGLQAALGAAQLRHVEQAIAAKERIGRLYDGLLADVPGLTLPPDEPWAERVSWVYGLLVEAPFGMSRADLQTSLAARGIETRRFFEPVHRQPILGLSPTGREGWRSVELAAKGIYLPSYVGMTEAEITQVCEVIRTASPPRTGGARRAESVQTDR